MADAPQTLVAQRDFKCTLLSCYGIGAHHATFITLQAFINKFAGVAGFTPLSLDGKIGRSTATAFKKAASYILAKSPQQPARWDIDGIPVTQFTYSHVALYALELIKTLGFWARSMGIDTPPGAMIPGSTGVAVKPAADQAGPNSQLPAPGSTNTPPPAPGLSTRTKWILGGVAGVLVLAVGIAAVGRRR